jgi:methylmalonyl-CoA mutase
MEKKGVDRIFFAGTPLAEMVQFVNKTYRGRRRTEDGGRKTEGGGPFRFQADTDIARALTAIETNRSPFSPQRLPAGPRVIGITGPGGAGKTTLIDEIALRFLKANPRTRLAILSHDPSLVGQGALLGDRAAMIHSQNDRVFMRSLATRGRAGGLSPATERCLRLLKRCPFDLVLIETVGIGQEAMPFGPELVNKTVFVMSPDYGSRLQLQKIVMLDVATIVVVNKSDLPGAKTASAEVEQRLALNGCGQKLVTTVAKRHGDPGVDKLFSELMS